MLCTRIAVGLYRLVIWDPEVYENDYKTQHHIRILPLHMNEVVLISFAGLLEHSTIMAAEH